MGGDLTGYGAAILCGGQSRRMGFDKSLALRNPEGRLLLAALAGELAGCFGEVALITNDLAKLAPLTELTPFRWAEDLHPGAGPAGGIHTALKALPGRQVFVMACDMPVIDWAVIGRLRALLEESRADAAAPRHGRFQEPLYAFYAPEAEPVFQNAVNRGRLAVWSLLSLLNTAYLDLQEQDLAGGLFRNINTPADLRRAGLPSPESEGGDGT